MKIQNTQEVIYQHFNKRERKNLLFLNLSFVYIKGKKSDFVCII